MATRLADARCYDLAETFLRDTDWFSGLDLEDRKDLVERLGNEIQDTIDDFIATGGEL